MYVFHVITLKDFPALPLVKISCCQINIYQLERKYNKAWQFCCICEDKREFFEKLNRDILKKLKISDESVLEML